MKKNCLTKIKYFKCKDGKHHTGICNPESENSSYTTLHKKWSHLLKKSLMENILCAASIKKTNSILLSSAESNTNITSNTNILQKTGNILVADEKKSLLNNKALCVPKIYSGIKQQNLSCVVKNHFIWNLPLANLSLASEANIDILIDADLHLQFVTGEVTRSKNCNLVTIKSIFGWLIGDRMNLLMENIIKQFVSPPFMCWKQAVTKVVFKKINVIDFGI